MDRDDKDTDPPTSPPDYTMMYSVLASEYGGRPSEAAEYYGADPWRLGYDLFTLRYTRKKHRLSTPGKSGDVRDKIDQLYMQAEGR